MADKLDKGIQDLGSRFSEHTHTVMRDTDDEEEDDETEGSDESVEQSEQTPTQPAPAAPPPAPDAHKPLDTPPTSGYRSHRVGRLASDR